jgi:hypothetical protein
MAEAALAIEASVLPLMPASAASPKLEFRENISFTAEMFGT